MSFNNDCKEWFAYKDYKVSFRRQKQRYYMTVKYLKLDDYKDYTIKVGFATNTYITQLVKRWFPDAIMTSFSYGCGTFFLYSFEDLIKGEVKQNNQLAIDNAIDDAANHALKAMTDYANALPFHTK
jgi:hypothetical protein